MLVATQAAVLRFHQHLAQLVGPDGAHAVFARAIDRARLAHPKLGEITIRPRETPQSDALFGRQPAFDRTVAAEALLALLAAATDLLTRLVGADMVDRFMQQTWRTDTFNGQRPDLATHDRRVRDGE